MKREPNVVYPGMVKSQPGISCSYTTGTTMNGKCRLNVARHYHNLTNQWGGKGRIKHLDHDGKMFDSVEEASAFALEHGYTFVFHRKAYGLRK